MAYEVPGESFRRRRPTRYNFNATDSAGFFEALLSGLRAIKRKSTALSTRYT